MLDLKIVAGIALGAFALSVLVGLVSGAAALIVLLRALGFSAVFAGLAVGGNWLVERFLPELVGDSTDDAESAPSGGDADDRRGYDAQDPLRTPRRRVDISVGDESIVAQRAAAAAEEDPDAVFDEPEAVLDLGDDLPAGLDQPPEAGYTEPVPARPADGGRKPANRAPAKPAPARPPALAGEVDILPDLESMSDSFVSASVEPMLDADEDEPYAPPARSNPEAASMSKFDSREMVSAIQTILKRDQKG